MCWRIGSTSSSLGATQHGDRVAHAVRPIAPTWGTWPAKGLPGARTRMNRPAKWREGEWVILTPPETAEKHVSFQGAELGADYPHTP